MSPHQNFPCITCLPHVKGRYMEPGVLNAMPPAQNHRELKPIFRVPQHEPCIATWAKCSIIIVQTPYLEFATTCLRVNPIIASDRVAIVQLTTTGLGPSPFAKTQHARTFLGYKCTLYTYNTRSAVSSSDYSYQCSYVRKVE